MTPNPTPTEHQTSNPVQDLEKYFTKFVENKRSCNECDFVSKSRIDGYIHLKEIHQKKILYSIFCFDTSTGSNSSEKYTKCPICNIKVNEKIENNEHIFDWQIVEESKN